MARFNAVLFSLALLSCVLALAHGQQAENEEEHNLRKDALHGFYVKDEENGELRLLANNPNFNAAINQFINQQQNFWESLRPVGNAANGLGTTGAMGAGAVTPIVIGPGQGTANNNAASVVPGLLPNIIGQVVANGGNNRRRRPNNNNINRRRNRPTIQIIRI